MAVVLYLSGAGAGLSIAGARTGLGGEFATLKQLAAYRDNKLISLPPYFS